jgi:hypothetical protein
MVVNRTTEQSGDSEKILLSCLQIWLIPLLHDNHSTYLTKLKNQTLVVSFFKCHREGEYHKVDVPKTKRGPNKTFGRSMVFDPISFNNCHLCANRTHVDY